MYYLKSLCIIGNFDDTQSLPQRLCIKIEKIFRFSIAESRLAKIFKIFATSDRKIFIAQGLCMKNYCFSKFL